MLNNGLLTKQRKIMGALLSALFIVLMGRAHGSQAGSTTAPAKPAPAQLSKPAKPAKPAATGKKKTSAKSAKALPAKPGRKAGAKRPAGGQKAAVVHERAPLAAGRRDPFREPKGGVAGMVVNEWEEVGSEPLPPGPRGLLVSQLKLEGIVREDLTNTMIAIVGTNTNYTYFLRQNDQIYRGVVSKITTDAIYFAMNYHDPLGNVQAHEVVARLGSAPGEGK